MIKYNAAFDEHHVLHELKHYLPAQSPLKDFVHHNTLHAFQDRNFHDALRDASHIFGYKVLLSLDQFREYYHNGRISPAILDQKIIERKGAEGLALWREKTLNTAYPHKHTQRMGQLRANWKKLYRIDLDLQVQPILFRVLCSYLDQGIAIWPFPISPKGFLASLREMEQNSFTGFFKHPRAKELLINNECEIDHLLFYLVGDNTLYDQYLFDQQFMHPGWSGIVSAIEDNPQSLLDERKITLRELIIFELLLEIDALDDKFHGNWAPMAIRLKEQPTELFAPVKSTELQEVLTIWQEAFEWTYYDEVLAGMRMEKIEPIDHPGAPFQALFCIDDRECSIRRYVELMAPGAQTFGTPGFFGVEFFYQPEHGKAYSKLCPAPVTPKYLIKEDGSHNKQDKSIHFTKETHSLIGGWLISQTVGFWSAFRLARNVLKPSMNAADSSSFRHMDQFSHLTIEHQHPDQVENGLQIGFTVPEMATRVKNVLCSIGLVKDFAPIVYIVGHGATSANNTHYAGYDCGACSGRPGSVNAKVFSFMANHSGVRALLKTDGIDIPESTQFIGALHDTTRDDIVFYEEDALLPDNLVQHRQNELAFQKALSLNAKERSRRFESIDSHLPVEKIHALIRERSVSLFEPRPELNHATNALCVVGPRELSKDLFLDRRSFMNSYDYRVDPTGEYLSGILNAVAPVCGGINLEYYFSRVDNHRLGAGTKLAHNVMGLFGVANGTDGDLRTGLPSQMIEVHDPVRLLVIVEHYPEVVLSAIQRSEATYEWFRNEWIHLVAINPDDKTQWVFKTGAFISYQSIKTSVETVHDLTTLLESNQENFPVYFIQ